MKLSLYLEKKKEYNLKYFRKIKKSKKDLSIDKPNNFFYNYKFIKRTNNILFTTAHFQIIYEPQRKIWIVKRKSIYHRKGKLSQRVFDDQICLTPQEAWKYMNEKTKQYDFVERT